MHSEEGNWAKPLRGSDQWPVIGDQ